MKPIAALIVGRMITSTVHVLILVPMFFALMKERALKHGALKASHEREPEDYPPHGRCLPNFQGRSMMEI